MEISNEKYLEKLGEEGKRAKKAFATGFLRGLSLVRILLEAREMDDGEKQAFYFGQICGVLSIWIVLLAVIWVFIGGQ